MNVSETALKELIARGDMASILRVFDSLQREVVAKDGLVQKHIIDDANLRNTFKEQEEELDRVRRIFEGLRETCARVGLEHEYNEIEGEIRKAANPEET